MGKFEVGQTVLVNTGHAILSGTISEIEDYTAMVVFPLFAQSFPILDIYALSEIDRLEEVAEREAFCKRELIAHFRGTLCAGR
jgi:hypothetical protein